MEQLNSTKSISIFEIIIHKYKFGLMIVGKLVWLEVRKEDISIALMIREEFSTSVLFKDIVEAISLILRYRTMWWLELEYFITSTTLDVHSIFILLSTMDWYLEVKIWAEDRQYSSCPLIRETKITKILNILTSLYHVEWNTCTVHGRGTKTRYCGLILILRSEKDEHSTKHDRMQLFFKGHFQPIAFQKLKDWKLEKSCMKDDTCLLDHHQRSHWDTITIGPEGMINWVLQLNISQLENSFNSLLEKHHVLSFPNQPNPNPIQSVIDRGNLRTQNVFLWRKEKRPVHKRSMINVCKKNLALHIDRGNLRDCLKTFVLSMLTMEQGNLWNRAQAHTQWKNNLFLPNIVTLHHLTRTTSSTLQPTRRISTSTSQECRIRWWNDHMASTFTTWFRRSRTTLSDKHFKVIFNNIEHSTLSAENHKTWSKPLETLNYARYSMLSQKHNAKHAWRIGTLASSTALAGTSYEMIRQKTRSTSSPFLISSLSRTFTSGRGRPHGHRYGKKEGDKEYHTANQLKKKCRKRGYNNIHDRFIRDTWFRQSMLEMDRTEEAIREMDRLANEDHTHIATEEELDVYRGNWWIRSNFVGSDTMPIRHRPDFKKALSTLHRLKTAEDQAYYQNWWQGSSSSWWQWQDFWWHPSSETSPRRWTWHWSNGETWEISETSIYLWHESHNEFGAKLQWSFR